MLQAILLNNMALMYCGDPRMMEIAELYQSIPVSMGRRKRLFDNHQTNAIENSDLTVYQKWRMWVQFEERRRLGYAIWVCTISESHPMLSLNFQSEY